MITCLDIIERRKRIWNNRGDIEYDRQYVRAAVIKILQTKELMAEIYKRPYLLIEIAFYIVDKKRRTVPFFLNEVQRDFQEFYEANGHAKPYFILKGRQQGFTSYITAMQLSFAIVRRNFSGMTLADKSSNTLAIFNDKARMVYERIPDELKPTERFSSKKELFFDKLNSSWRIDTASGAVGRSRTLNFIHYSEVAFYKCSLAEMQSGIGEAATADAFCVYETTANGFGESKDLWDSDTCYNLFYEWWRTKEYRSKDHQFLETNDPWLVERIAMLREKGLDDDQIAWYAKKYNGYIDKRIIKQEYPCTPDEAFISSGASVFDVEKITNQLIRLDKVGRIGKVGNFVYDKVVTPIKDSNGRVVDTEWTITNIRFEERADGMVCLHDEPKIKTDDQGVVTAKAPYALGGDVAGLGEDFYTGKVVCCLDGTTAATLRVQRIDEDLYAEQMYCLGWYFNTALIGIETNYSRQSTRILSDKYRYPKMYLRQRVDRIDSTVDLVYGFETTSKTKPLIIGELVAKMREDPQIEVDIDTLREMLVFVKKENGSQEAVDGYHDDLVMALAITHFISNQQDHDWIPVKREEDHFLRDNFGFEKQPSGNAAYVSWEV
ncbi:MAG: hypothetical protein J6S14_12795 [Clostridia bacterium]|nr:hypothetical protein [Clostridia bacterium]